MPLVGETYEFYSYKCLTDYATEAEDRLSFLCLCDEQGYPQWLNVNACLFTAGANPESKVLNNDSAERHLEKAHLLSKAFCHGVIVKNGSVSLLCPGPFVMQIPSSCRSCGFFELITILGSTYDDLCFQR